MRDASDNGPQKENKHRGRASKGKRKGCSPVDVWVVWEVKQTLKDEALSQFVIRLMYTSTVPVMGPFINLST